MENTEEKFLHTCASILYCGGACVGSFLYKGKWRSFSCKDCPFSSENNGHGVNCSRLGVKAGGFMSSSSQKSGELTMHAVRFLSGLTFFQGKKLVVEHMLSPSESFMSSEIGALGGIEFSVEKELGGNVVTYRQKFADLVHSYCEPKKYQWINDKVLKNANKIGLEDRHKNALEFSMKYFLIGSGETVFGVISDIVSELQHKKDSEYLGVLGKKEIVYNTHYFTAWKRILRKEKLLADFMSLVQIAANSESLEFEDIYKEPGVC